MSKIPCCPKCGNILSGEKVRLVIPPIKYTSCFKVVESIPTMPPPLDFIEMYFCCRGYIYAYEKYEVVKWFDMEYVRRDLIGIKITIEKIRGILIDREIEERRGYLIYD